MTRASSIGPLAGLMIVALVLAGSHASAQNPFYYTSKLEGTSMRSSGLADASSADSWDVTTMYWNPGGLSFLHSKSPIFTHTVDWNTRAQTENIAVALFGYRSFTFAAGGMISHSGRLTPGEGYSVPFNEAGFDLAASYAIIPTMSMGVLVGGRRSTFDGVGLNSAWAQLGVFYYPSPGIAYGLVHRVFRGTVYWAANDQSGVVPDQEIRQNLELGATMTFPMRSDRPIVTLSLTTEKYFPGVAISSTKGGLEIFPWRFFAVRIGFKVGSVERVARYGFGIHIDPVHLDVALAPSRAESRFHGISLSITL